MDNLFVFIVSFIIIFVVFIILYFIKRIRGKLATSKDVMLLTSRFKLNKKYLNYNVLGLVFALVNSLIISTTGTLVTMINYDYIWQLLIGFVLLMIFIYVIYGLIGLYLKRREDKHGKRKKNRS